MSAPRTTQEEIAAKKAWRAEKERRRAQHAAAADTHRRVEERRRRKTEEAFRRQFAEPLEIAEEADQRLAALAEDLSGRETQALKEEKARVIRIIRRAQPTLSAGQDP